MSRSVTLTGVADSDVPRVKAQYEHEGATVTVTPDDGADTSTVVAVWPDAAAAPPAMVMTGAAHAHAAAAQAHAAAATAHASTATALLAAARGMVPRT